MTTAAHQLSACTHGIHLAWHLLCAAACYVAAFVCHLDFLPLPRLAQMGRAAVPWHQRVRATMAFGWTAPLALQLRQPTAEALRAG